MTATFRAPVRASMISGVFSRLLVVALLLPVCRVEAVGEACKRRLLRVAAAAGVVTAGIAVGYGAFESYENDAVTTRREGAEGLHVAVLGDSLATDFSYRGLGQSIFRMRTTRNGGWLVDRELGNAEGSLFDLCPDIGRADCYASVGSWISPKRGVQSWKGKALHLLGRVADVPSQVDALIREEKFPEVILVSGGHNDADIVYSHLATGTELDFLARTVPQQMEADLENSLVRLAEEARKRRSSVKVAVMGMLDFQRAIEVRKKILELHRTRGLYPELPLAIEGFPTLMPEHEAIGSRVSDDVDNRWRAVVDRLNARYRNDQIFFRYVDALHGMDLKVEDVSAEDGLHLSRVGSSRVARRLSAELWDWLRIQDPRSARSSKSVPRG